MKEEKVEFYNDKNQKLVGLLSLPDKEKPPIAIIIHGFKGTKEYYPFVNNSIKPLTDAGIAVLRIDCRGSVESDLEFKDMTIKSESEDVLTAIEFVKTLDVDSRRISLIGISMGATAVLMAMKYKPDVKTLVFWGPAFYYNGDSHYNTSQNRKTVEEEGVFYVRATITGKQYIAGKEHFKEITTLDIRPYMKFVNLPVLIIRGSEDEIVGTGKDKEVIKLIKAEYKLVEKGDHNFTNKDSERELIEKTLDWFKKYLK
jgi:dipeptidyl aminopeptidase/acylaminoacyl peptidase